MRFKATDKQRDTVAVLAGIGVPSEIIARTIGCTAKTLRAHFRAELDSGFAIANAAVANSLFKKAIGNDPGSVAAAIFWCKTRLGWKEKSELDITGSLAIRDLTDDQLVARIAANAKIIDDAP